MKNHRTGYFVINENSGFVMAWSKEKHDAEMQLLTLPGCRIYSAPDIVVYKYCAGWLKIKCIRPVVVNY